MVRPISCKYGEISVRPGFGAVELGGFSKQSFKSMPRLLHSLLLRARNISPLLPLLLRPCRTLPSARNELRWLRDAKLTIITTGASTAALHYQRRPFVRLGEGTLAAILFLWLPFRRRNWQAMFGLLLVATLAAVVSGCGVSKSPTTTQVTGGTTAGAYTVTITGTSGSMQSTTNVSVTVQ